MIRPLPAVDDGTPAKLEVGIGYASNPDTTWAALRALAMARGALSAGPDLVLVVTAGVPTGEVVSTIQGVLGHVDVAGGATSALLTEQGPIDSGALVVCLTNAEGEVSGVAAAPGRDLAEAAQRAARLILAGWPFRSRYPRGLGIAFARPGCGAPAAAFLPTWRLFMGPKMRTVCSVLSSPVLYGACRGTALMSVACLEATYATGLGHAAGFAPDGSVPDPNLLLNGAVDAAMTAIKRLEGHPARLVLVIQSEARRRALGPAAAHEWAALRSEIGERTPCVGWVCDEVAAYGRGVRPASGQGAMVVVALGDSPRR